MRAENVLILLAVVSLVALMINVVFAQEAEPEAPLVAFFTNAVKIALVPVLMAVATSVLGYLRSMPPEKFELDKFLAIIIISLLMGVLTIGFGWD